MSVKGLKGLKLINIVLLVITLIYYRIIWDVFILMMLLVSAYCYGNLVYKKGKSESVKFAIGLGTIGILINFILLIGIGSKSFMLIIVLSPIIIMRRELIRIFRGMYEKVYNMQISEWSVLLVIIMLFFLVMGSAPIDAREGDALGKHLPITVYAALDGIWNFNVSEGVGYGESMLLTYTYWTFFYSMHAYKAITLFNTVLMGMMFFVLCKISKNIYPNTNCILLGIIYFSSPLFFDLGTMMGTDMLSIYFLVSAVAVISSINLGEIWDCTFAIAFLCGCSLFSKLTVVNNILLVVITTIVSDVIYAIRENKIRKLYIRIIMAGLLGCVILLPNIIVVWEKIGNPFLPAYNGIFHSAYAPLNNFQDPYSNAPFSFSFKTLLDLVFNTSRNRIEGLNRDLGLFPFGVFFIPVAIWWRREKKFILACFWPFMSIIVGCIFTYNLRYLASTFLFFMIMIVVTFSVIVDTMLKNKLMLWTLNGILMCSLLLFNLYTFRTLKPYIVQAMKVNEDITHFFMTDILKELPVGKRVMMVDPIPYKADYRGYFVSNNWYISYILEKIEAGELSWEDYVNSFDYVLDSLEYSNTIDELDALVASAGKEGALLEPFIMDDYIMCYKVNHHNAGNKKVLYDIQNMEAQGYIDGNIENLNIDDSCLIIKSIVENSGEETVICVNLAWFDAENIFLDSERQFFRVPCGSMEYESFVFDKVKDAQKASVVLEVINQESKEKCKFQTLQVQSYSNFIIEETMKIESRE